MKLTNKQELQALKVIFSKRGIYEIKMLLKVGVSMAKIYLDSFDNRFNMFK